MLNQSKKLLILSVLFFFAATIAIAQDANQEEKQKTMEIYGFIMMDASYNANRSIPIGLMRIGQLLPSYKNEFGTRLYFKNYFQAGLGELKGSFLSNNFSQAFHK